MTPLEHATDCWDRVHKAHPNAQVDFMFLSGYLMALAYCSEHGVPAAGEAEPLKQAIATVNRLARAGGRPI